MPKFRGVYPAFLTPTTQDGGLNEPVFREVMEFNIQQGAHGFWVAGGTGESVLLDDAENMRIAEIASDQSRGRAKNIMHVGAPTTLRAARMAEHAAGAGVDAICCVPPYFYDRSDDEIVEHYRTIAAAADLPFFVYNIPKTTGVEIMPDLMRKIQDRVPQLAGLKHSPMDISNIRAFAKMGLSCFVGHSHLMLPALTIGAVGCIDGPLNIAPELWVELWDAYNAGDLRRAEAAQDKATELNVVLNKFGLHATVKAAISERLGIDCGAPRLPGQPISPEGRAEVVRTLAALGISSVPVLHGDD